MLLSLASLLFLADISAATPATAPAAQQTVVISPAAQSSTQPTQIVINTPAATAPLAPVAPSNIVDAFARTRLFQLAEGKQTTSLHDMLQLAFWLDTVKELVIAALVFIPRVLVSLLFLVVFWLIYRAIRRVLYGAMQRANVDVSIRDLLVTLTKWVVMGFGVVIACNQIGIPIVAMLTGVSILGLAVGFAAQETLANFIAGVVIFWDKPFKVGDWLTVDNVFGQVQRITFRSCRMLNMEGEFYVFPNTFMLANKVANHSTHPVSRVSVEIGIAYKESITTARAALLETTNGDARIRTEPKPEVVVSKLGDSSVELKLRFWVDDEKLERRLHYEYNEKAKLALDAAGIEIPFPHVQLMVENTPAIDSLARVDGPRAA